MHRIIFFLFLLLPLAGQAYLSRHIYSIVPGPLWVKVALVVVATLCLLSLFFQLFMRDALPTSLSAMLYNAGSWWLLVLLYGCMLFAVLDLGRLCRVVPPSLLSNSVVGTALVVAVVGGLLAAGGWCYHNKVRTELTIHSNKPMARPLRVVLLSDLHLGYHNRKPELERWVKLINNEKPDLILIAGDVIDNSVKPLLEENMQEALRQLNAPVYTCLGNHEYFATTPAAAQFLNDANIHLLVDESVTVGDITIIGRDDRSNPERAGLPKLVAAADTSKFTILLDHQPYHLEHAQRCGIDFQFSGHTHRGQVWPISWITDRLFEVSYGFKQKGNTAVYVSSGMGIWGPRARIGTVSEYIVATIEP